MKLDRRAIRLARKHGLTPRRAKFWLLFYLGGVDSGAEAARQAGYSQARNEAYRMTTSDDAVLQAENFLAELTEDAELAKGLTGEHVLAGLLKEARTCETDGARVRSWELLGKAKRLFVDQIEIQDSSPDQVMAALKTVLPSETAQQIADQLGVTVVTELEDGEPK